MEENLIIEKLTGFGLTRQEASIYISLIQNGESTGYEVAKATGISRSNVYNALSGLTDKGGAYLMEGTAARYLAVPISEFCGNVIKQLNQEAAYLSDHMPDRKTNTEGYITIQGDGHIMNKISNMMETCEKRLYIAATSSLLRALDADLIETIKRNIKVVIISDEDYCIEGATIYHTSMEQGQIRFITDSSYVLTGMITGHAEDTCLYSGQENLVTVFKEALKNKITLIKMESEEK